MGILGPNVNPDQGIGGNGVGEEGAYSYCGDIFEMAPHTDGLAPVPIPCGHGGSVHANCLWNRADQVAHGRADP